jgi:thiamine-phosphate pyrophosphorylase
MTHWNRDVLRLYLVTDNALARGRPLLDIVRAAVEGGVTCVQLREKELSTRDFLHQATRLMQMLAPHRVPLVINDRIDIALACGAHGVHLGQSDLPAAQARRLLPAGTFIGLSVENLDQVEEASTLPVDYLGISPVFETATKVDAPTPWGIERLQLARALSPLPMVAIGGINEGNARTVLRAGADGLAVVSALCAADDPRDAAKRLRRLIDDSLQERQQCRASSGRMD